MKEWQKYLLGAAVLTVVVVGLFAFAGSPEYEACRERDGFWVPRGNYCMTPQGPVFPWDLTKTDERGTVTP